MKNKRNQNMSNKTKRRVCRASKGFNKVALDREIANLFHNDLMELDVRGINEIDMFMKKKSIEAVKKQKEPWSY